MLLVISDKDISTKVPKIFCRHFCMRDKMLFALIGRLYRHGIQN